MESLLVAIFGPTVNTPTVYVVLTGGTLIAAATALIGVGVMKEKVRGHSEALKRHSQELASRPTKTEFEQLCDKIDSVHMDVREIRQAFGRRTP